MLAVCIKIHTLLLIVRIGRHPHCLVPGNFPYFFPTMCSVVFQKKYFKKLKTKHKKFRENY